MNILHKQSGLSLVEILVAMVISLFLLGGIISVYIGNKSTYKFSDANSRIQENARFALDIITADARMSGFWGCTDLQADKNNNGSLIEENSNIQNHLTFEADYEPELYDFIDLPPITATVNDGLNGSDSLTIRGAKPGQSVFIADLVEPGDTDIVVSAMEDLKANDIVLITNCYTGNIFRATAVDTSAGVTTISHAESLMNRKDKPYTPNNAAAFSLQTVTYSIEPSETDANRPALYRSVNNIKEELIEGAEQMQVLFGEDTDNDGTPNQYLTSDNVADMYQVTAIRIWLVLTSDEANVLEKSQAYKINGESFNANDLRMRQVYSSTIALRNREG